MENIEQRVKKIVAEQLGVNEATSRTNPRSWRTSGPTRSTPLSS